MRDKYGVSRVWLASDSATTIEELREADPSFEYLQLAGSVHAAQLSGLTAHITPILRSRMGLLDRKAVSEAGLLDLFLLRDCDFFVGQFTSALSLLALELSAAEKGLVPPYIGLDGPWQSLVN
ncbi:hypothetical protein T484DRAFT_1880699 [Baffinella frigidus]|nr:hypothetical protein T484DRAFT_1880699 [Cryptophyta sp. CCMP2293]